MTETTKTVPGPGPYTLGDIHPEFPSVNHETTVLYRAAPDLLTALNKAYTELSQIAWLNPGMPTEARVLTEARAAIAKAQEGK